MIIKFYEYDKVDLNKNKFFLLYGNNEGLKKEIINKLNKNNNTVNYYDEKEILDLKNNFFENLLNKSLFEEKKNIIIKRASDKILKIIEEIYTKNIDDLIIIVTDNLEKKSKLRSYFEKKKNFICIPFYPDNEQTLSKLTNDFFKENKISISQVNINLIVSKCNGDRENLNNELEKIKHYLKSKKKLTSENLAKLINLSENYSVSELIDNCLAQNKHKVVTILNENNYNKEDCIIISRTFLNKSKKILNYAMDYEKNKNIELTISSAKPPIFWKDKEIIKKQILRWKVSNIKNLLYEINEIELIIKKDLNNSIKLLTNFILEKSILKN